MKKKLGIAMLLAMLCLPGCALTVKTWYVNPPEGDYPVKLTAWPPVAVTIADERSIAPNAARLWYDDVTAKTQTGAVVAAIQKALADSFGPSQGAPDLRLHIRVLDYSVRMSDPPWWSMSGSSWIGTAAFQAELSRGGQPVRTWKADGSGTRFNWFGPGSAESAGQEAFRDAMTSLLVQLAGVSGSELARQ